jgi:hypothetical protein
MASLEGQRPGNLFPLTGTESISAINGYILGIISRLNLKGYHIFLFRSRLLLKVKELVVHLPLTGKISSFKIRHQWVCSRNTFTMNINGFLILSLRQCS